MITCEDDDETEKIPTLCMTPVRYLGICRLVKGHEGACIPTNRRGAPVARPTVTDIVTAVRLLAATVQGAYDQAGNPFYAGRVVPKAVETARLFCEDMEANLAGRR